MLDSDRHVARRQPRIVERLDGLRDRAVLGFRDDEGFEGHGASLRLGVVAPEVAGRHGRGKSALVFAFAATRWRQLFRLQMKHLALARLGVEPEEGEIGIGRLERWLPMPTSTIR